MQQRRAQAAIGATVLGSAWSTTSPRPADVARAIALVSSAASNTADATPGDPIVAARRWLADPVRARSLGAELHGRADRALDVAERHVVELQELVVDLTAEVNAARVPDPARIALLDDMALQISSFSERLRALLDVEHPVEDASERLERGLEAASSGGGLRALVAAL